jgi:hypothetical protein
MLTGQLSSHKALEGNPTADRAFRFDVGMANSSGWPYVPEKYLVGDGLMIVYIPLAAN